jgi:hypothetical protein
MTMTFNNESTGTIVWPGGTVPIQRFNIVPNGLTALPCRRCPRAAGGGTSRGRPRLLHGVAERHARHRRLHVRRRGNPVWYLTVGAIGGPAAISAGTWWSYTGGQTLTGAWRQNTRSNSNVAPMPITFSAPDTR